MKIEFTPEEFQQLLNLVGIVPTGRELPDDEDIAELELAIDVYTEQRGDKYPVTVKRLNRILDNLRDLKNCRMVEREK